jgi:hypothetical protein
MTSSGSKDHEHDGLGVGLVGGDPVLQGLLDGVLRRDEFRLFFHHIPALLQLRPRSGSLFLHS